MSKRVTLDLPDSIYERACQDAARQGKTVEIALVDALSKVYRKALNDSEYKELLAGVIEATEWWNAEGDKEWDRWQP